MKAASVGDYRELARRRLPHFLFEYIDGGSYAEVTLRRNRDDLAQLTLRQRVLRDVSAIDLSTEWFGQKLAMPVALAPIGLAGLNARRGEVQAARAAQAAGVLLGRAWAFALAAGGQAAVARMLEIIGAEMRVAMALTGCTRVAAIDSGILVDRPGPGA